MNNVTKLSGKWAGLVWLIENKDLGYKVPEFDGIDAPYYNEFLKDDTNRLEDRCTELAKRFDGRKIAVRSSAMVSEDSDKFSGAGIYDTVFIESENLNNKTLMGAVLQAYASVNSEKAVQYRKQAGLGDEIMEVVVQEFAPGHNGVAMSRLPGRDGIIPFYWSETSGAVVSGEKQAKPIHTMYFTSDKGKRIFRSDTNVPSVQERFIKTKFSKLLKKIKNRYKGNFELEFAVDFNHKVNNKENNYQINLLQIRPLTNVQDKEVTFPDKKPILTAEYCMGVGEYIGPWVTPMEALGGLIDPDHYAYAASELWKTFAGISEKDYDLLTPNKKAIVLTKYAQAGLHALTIANEKDILCLTGDGPEISDEQFKEAHGYNRAMLNKTGHGGGSVLLLPSFEIPLKDVGDYIHIVSDGLKGYVYKATKQEADVFAANMLSSITYDISSIIDPLGGEDLPDGFFDWEFTIKPSDTTVYEAICKDFVKHIEEKIGRKARVDPGPGNNHYDMEYDEAQCETFTAFFNPDKKENGIELRTGRSAHELADKDTTRKWFQEFIDKVQTKGYIPKG